MSDLLVQAVAALVITVDPLGLVPVFLALTAHLGHASRRRAAIKACGIGAGVLMAFALAGQAALTYIGVGMPAFRVGGGILLLLLAVDMLFARSSGLRATTPPELEEAEHSQDVSVFPLAIPLIAGPGAMTSVVLLMERAGPDLGRQALVVGVLLAVLALTLVLFLSSGPVGRLLGITGTNVISRVLGIILAALACQFILDGVSEGLRATPAAGVLPG